MWFKVDDGFAFHPKTLRAGKAAVGSWICAGTWAAAHLTDGYVPRHVLPSLGTPAHASALVAAGFWIRVNRPDHLDRDGQPIDGWQFHDWLDYQPAAAKVKAEREAARVRVAEARAKKRAASSSHAERSEDVRANTPGTFDGRSASPTRPDPTPTGETSGGDVTHLTGLEPGEPPRRCIDHLHADNPPPCGGCGKAREANERWHADRAAEADAAEREERARIRAEAIAGCDLCDENGRANGRTCNHDPSTADAAAIGAASVRAAMTGRTA